MISRKHKFIFIHIPKCGGTSVELALLKNEGIKPTAYSKSHLDELSHQVKVDYLLGYDDNQHNHIIEYGQWSEKTYFTFSFVRNPWDRLVSEYFYLISRDGGYCDKTKFDEEYKSFAEFIKKDGMKCAAAHHGDFQIDFILNFNKNKLVDFVGRCEHMQRDFNYICDRIGIPQIKLPYRNATKHEPYTNYYNDETRKIVAEKYKKDIEMFGYEFGE